MRLLSILHRLPPDEVQAVAASHQMPDTTEPEALVNHLAQSRVLMNLLRNELRPVIHLLERLAVFGPTAALDSDLVAGVPVTRLQAVHRRGLLFLQPSARSPETVVLPLEYALMREVKRPPSSDLLSALRVLSVDHARLIARFLETDERRISSLLLADLFDELRTRSEALAQDLPAEERRVLDDLLAQGGQMDAGSFHRQFPLGDPATSHGPFSLTDVVGLGRDRRKPTPAQRLFQKGLLHAATRRDAPGGPVEQVFVPAELVKQLSGEWAGRREAEAAREQAAALVDEPAGPVRPATPDLQRRLRIFALAAECIGYEFVQAGSPRQDHLDRVSRLHPLNEFDQEVLVTLGRRLGVFELQGNRLALADRAETTLDAEPDGFRAQVRALLLDESGDADPLRARFARLLLGRLGEHEGQWLRVAGLPGILRTDAEYRRTVTVHDVETSTERARLESILEELRDLGFVDLAGETGQAEAVRYRSQGTTPPTEAMARPLTIPPNLDVVVPLSAPFSVLRALGRVADPRVLDVAAVFALNETSLVRGTLQGVSLDQARSFLAEHCAHPLPDTVERLISDVGSREGEVQILPVRAVLLLRDTELDETALEHPELGPMVLSRLAPGVLAIAPDASLDTLHRVLGQMGWQARISP